MSNSLPETPKRGFTIDLVRGDEEGKPIRRRLLPGNAEDAAIYTNKELAFSIDLMLKFPKFAMVGVLDGEGGMLVATAVLADRDSKTTFITDATPGSKGIHLPGGN